MTARLRVQSLCAPSVPPRLIPVNSNLQPIFGRLHEYLSLSTSCSGAASQPGHMSIAARVLGAHNRSPSFSKCFTSSLRLHVYRALPESCSFLSRLSSLAMMMGFHCVQLTPSFDVSSPINVESMNPIKASKELAGRVIG